MKFMHVTATSSPNKENTDYFNQYDWYRNMPKETDMSIVASEFSSVEKKNVEALQAYEDSKDWD